MEIKAFARGSLLAFVFTALVIDPSSARATLCRSFPASHCQAYSYSSPYNGATASLGYPGSGQVSNPNDIGRGLICPVMTDTYIEGHDASVTITVDGFKNSNTYTTAGCSDFSNMGQELAACRTYYGGGGGTCGTQSTGMSTGTTYSQSLNTSGWTSGNILDYYYVAVHLGCKTAGGSQETLFGYRITNP